MQHVYHISILMAAPPGRNLTTSTSKPPFPFSTCSSQVQVQPFLENFLKKSAGLQNTQYIVKNQPRSCPDGRCDQHEASQPGICPQDCTPKGIHNNVITTTSIIKILQCIVIITTSIIIKCLKCNVITTTSIIIKCNQNVMSSPPTASLNVIQTRPE